MSELQISTMLALVRIVFPQGYIIPLELTIPFKRFHPEY